MQNKKTKPNTKKNSPKQPQYTKNSTVIFTLTISEQSHLYYLWYSCWRSQDLVEKVKTWRRRNASFVNEKLFHLKSFNILWNSECTCIKNRKWRKLPVVSISIFEKWRERSMWLLAATDFTCLKRIVNMTHRALEGYRFI